jgi:hypothetical protein
VAQLVEALRYKLEGSGFDSRLPIPVAERSTSRVCGRSVAGVAGSNQAGGMDVCVVCCTVRTKIAKARTIRTKKYR